MSYAFRLLEVYTELGIVKRKVLYATKGTHDFEYCLVEYTRAMNENKDDKVRIVLELDDLSQPATLAKRFKPRHTSGNSARFKRGQRIKEQLRADAKRREQNEANASLSYYETHKFSCHMPRCGKRGFTEQGLHTHLRLRHDLTWHEIDKLEKQQHEVKTN